MKETTCEKCKDFNTYNKLKKERDFYKRIVENIPAVVHINNFNKEYVEWVNLFGEKLSGYPKSFIEKNKDFFSHVLVPDDIDWLQRSISEIGELNTDQIYASIYSMRHADGSVATYHSFSKILEFDKAGNPLFALGVDVDISHEIKNFKQLKRQVDELNKKLNQEKIKALTKTEIKVAQLLCEFKSQKQIAEILNRSFHTIDKHKRSIFKKLEFNKIQQLVVWGKEVGLV